MSSDAERGRALRRRERHRPAATTASTSCWPTRRSRPSTSAPRTSCTARRRWPRPPPASTCCARSRWRSPWPMPARWCAACREAGVVMGTNHHLRNAATHRAMREAIAAGPDRHGRSPPACSTRSTCRRTSRAGGSTSPRPAAASCSTSPSTTPTRCASCSTTSRSRSWRSTQSAGHGRAGLEDGAMAVVRFRSGLLAQLHEAFTAQLRRHRLRGARHRGLADRPRRDDPAAGRRGDPAHRRTASETLPVEHENLYERALAPFHAAMRGEGQPAATGEDGVRSLALALAVREAAASGRRTIRSRPSLES